jgi:hypothetical protein
VSRGGAIDPQHPPPSLEEQYEVATVTSDLGLPHGAGAGAQGILAAAAWTEVHMGSALRRMRAQWDSIRPVKKAARPYELLRGAGWSREAARALHNRERVQNGLTYIGEKKAARRRLREYDEVLQQLALHAVKLGIEEPDTHAQAVLDRWLDDPNAAPDSMGERQLWVYLGDCLNRARAGLKLGMRGITNHSQPDE